MKTRLLSVLIAALLSACIAQKPMGVTFTESGKGAGIYSGQVDKTATGAAATVSSIANSIGTSVVVLEFTVKENGSKDGYPLQIRELRFTNIGTADVADLRFVLEGPGSNNTVSQVGGNPVTFKDFGDIIVADGDTTGKTYQVKVHVRTNIQGSMTDNNTIILKTSPVTDFDVVEASSNFLQSVTAFQQGSATSVDIVATEILGKNSFNGLIATVGQPFPGPPSVYATDLNGRVDKDFTGTITITSHTSSCPNAIAGLSAPSGCALACPATQGVATWTGLQFASANTIKIQATSPGLVSLCSASVTVNP
jgi:hypothetical protein